MSKSTKYKDYGQECPRAHTSISMYYCCLKLDSNSEVSVWLICTDEMAPSPHGHDPWDILEKLLLAIEGKVSKQISEKTNDSKNNYQDISCRISPHALDK